MPFVRDGAGDQAGLRAFQDKARVGATRLGTKGTVQREYTRALIRDFGQGCDVTLVGAADLASLAETALSGGEITDREISAEIAPCFVGDGASDPARTDTVVLACTHYPLLMERLVCTGAMKPVEILDRSGARDRPAGCEFARARQAGEADHAGAEMIFTSKRPHTLIPALMPFLRRPRSGVN